MVEDGEWKMWTDYTWKTWICILRDEVTRVEERGQIYRPQDGYLYHFDGCMNVHEHMKQNMILPKCYFLIKIDKSYFKNEVIRWKTVITKMV